MSDELPWTGERYVPALSGDIAREHLHRYSLAASLTVGLDILDIASGEGYGSALLARSARSVVGVDIAPDAVEHARRTYAPSGLEFRLGSCTEIPLADASVDAVVSFETIEHLEEHERAMEEMDRVLRPGGFVIISSPNRVTYSEGPGYSNPFHVRELDLDGFGAMLRPRFPQVRFYGQTVVRASLVCAIDGRPPALAGLMSGARSRASGHLGPAPAWIYFIAIAARAGARLPELRPSLFRELVDPPREI